MAESKLREWWNRQRFGDEVTVPDVEARGTPGATVDNYETARGYVNGAGETFSSADYGIALSGGGIRSASFSTGVLQALAGGSHALERADYLATVSGGGYVGVSTQMLHHVQQPLPAPENAYAQPAPEFAWLTAKHRYLGRRWQLLVGALGFVARTVLNVGTIAALVFLAGFWIGWLATVIWEPPDAWLVVAIAIATLGVTLRQYSLPNSPVWRHLGASAAGRKRMGRLGSSAGAMIVVACSVVVIAMRTPGLGPILWVGGALIAVGFVLQYVRELRWARFLGVCLLEVAWVFGAWLLALVGARWAADAPVALVGGATVLLAAFLIWTDQTMTSPHQLYKERLASTFGIRRAENGIANIAYDVATTLDHWGGPYVAGQKVGPTLIVCATANVNDTDVPPSGYRSAPFAFSHDYVGSPELGYWPTPGFMAALGRRLGRDGTLEAAMAISGAAVASAMGARTRVPALGRLAVLLNLRLGVWLPNPRATATWPDEGQSKGRWIRRRRGIWLIREVLGVFPSTRRFVYVSDGGHLDNLGLLELLRRRCRMILVVDASGDPLRSTVTFDEVLDLAKTHLGIEVVDDGELRALRDEGDFADLPSDRVSEKCVAVIKFRYPESLGAAERDGTIVLAKATFARELGNNCDARRAASRWHTDWRPRLWPGSARTVPRTSTFNQLLSDNVFEAYVELGRAVGECAVERLGQPVHGGAGRLAATRDPFPITASAIGTALAEDGS